MNQSFPINRYRHSIRNDRVEIGLFWDTLKRRRDPLMPFHVVGDFLWQRRPCHVCRHKAILYGCNECQHARKLPCFLPATPQCCLLNDCVIDVSHCVRQNKRRVVKSWRGCRVEPERYGQPIQTCLKVNMPHLQPYLTARTVRNIAWWRWTTKRRMMPCHCPCHDGPVGFANARLAQRGQQPVANDIPLNNTPTDPLMSQSLGLLASTIVT